MVLIWRSR